MAIHNQISTYVSGVTWDGTVVTATATGDSTITGSAITLTPSYNNGQVNWVCRGTILSKYRPASCQ